MTEEDRAADARDGDALLYDYYKHLTSLCLFSLAGGVALTDKAQGRWAVMLVAALVAIGLAALISFTGAGQIVGARAFGTPPDPYPRFTRTAPPTLLSLGIGILLYIFARSLKF